MNLVAWAIALGFVLVSPLAVFVGYLAIQAVERHWMFPTSVVFEDEHVRYDGVKVSFRPLFHKTRDCDLIGISAYFGEFSVPVYRPDDSTVRSEKDRPISRPFRPDTEWHVIVPIPLSASKKLPPWDFCLTYQCFTRISQCTPGPEVKRSGASPAVLLFPSRMPRALSEMVGR